MLELLNKLARVSIYITENVNLEMSQSGIIVLVLFVVTALSTATETHQMSGNVK